jgi:hypothetical protein
MTFKTILLGGALATAAMTLAVPASAYIACNRNGDCWHTERRVGPRGARFRYHPDDWYFHQNWDDRRYRWRAYREGRGYWRNGVWITF